MKASGTPPTLSTVILACLYALLCSTPGRAASDCDVYMTKATDVTISDSKIVITGEAMIKMIVITEETEAHKDKRNWYMGRPRQWVVVKADKATFTVHKPSDKAADPFWNDSLAAARKLKAGKKIGRIGYYRPEVVIRENTIRSINGRAFIYQ